MCNNYEQKEKESSNNRGRAPNSTFVKLSASTFFGTLFALIFWIDADYALFIVLFGLNLN